MQNALLRFSGMAKIACLSWMAMTCSSHVEAASAATKPHSSAVRQVRQQAAGQPSRASSSTQATRLQLARLRYTGLSSLPKHARHEFRSPVIEAADDAEERCARANSSSTSADTVAPCLGLYRGAAPRSPVRFSFDLSLKSIGAPKDVLIGGCPASSNMTSCNTVISEAKAEQERLADTLNRQRRYPVATLGVAVSF